VGEEYRPGTTVSGNGRLLSEVKIVAGDQRQLTGLANPDLASQTVEVAFPGTNGAIREHLPGSCGSFF